MARVTVEDCIDKVESPYELVLVAKERTTQLNSGVEPSVSIDNDKNTVISLREIGEGKVSIKNLEDAGINKLRKHYEEKVEVDELEEENEDNLDKIYKGEISKSGAPILPSKRARKSPEKIQVSKEDLAELSETAKPDIENIENTESDETDTDEGDLSLDQVSEAEEQSNETVSDDNEPNNS